MIRVSASAVPRLLACPGSAQLPHHDYRTRYADAGTEHHAADEEAASEGRIDDLPSKVSALIGTGMVRVEQPLAYDCASDTARELPKTNEKRAYVGLSSYEIPGTPDLVIVRDDGRSITVVDYKEHERVDPAVTNTQTLTYALALARLYRVDEVTVAIYYRTSDWLDVATHDSFALDAHAQRLRSLQVEVLRKPLKLATGKQCKYCPAFLSCPQQQAFALDVGGEMPLRVEAAMPFNDDAEAARAFDLLERIKMLTARLSAGLHARAAERPFILSDGRVFGPREKLGNEKLDGDTVYQVIREQHGQAIADAAVERVATKKRIKDALGFVGAKGKVAGLERAVLDEVRARGGIKQETKTVVEVYSPKELKAG